ncbi:MULTISPECIES: alpha/beta hydrolase [unclassified Pseudoalteromonas]|uniref:alpha/beta hydrolase n=1 Tax=unclassified Pseudoalteromonas TaxID=194690 RepID=UPI0025B45F48|nr:MULTISPECIES: alpha/beta hydrolase [unclassified Pseudoalteromonas]MDN3385947.1 alpha/beta hydrolase [Pseudoalteromonas sp. APC 4017]
MRTYLCCLLKIIAITLLLPGCNSRDNNPEIISNEPQNGQLRKVTVSGRSYYLAQPKNKFEENKAYKLLLAFHGSSQRGKNMQRLAAIESASNDYIVVYPQAKGEEWNEGCNCNKAHRLGIDDLAFVSDVVADVKTKYNIIGDELYAVGFSQGGLFTQNLMCNSTLKFNAIASVAAPMSEQLSQSCYIENNTNYMMIHGKVDNTLSYNGLIHSNFGLISSENAIALIAGENGIATEVEVDTTDIMTKFVYQNSTHINQLIAIEKGGHSWAYTGFNTTDEIVNFFDSVSQNKLDTHSSLYRVESQPNKDVHVRSMGLQHKGPTIVLLSGFNKNYHSDSAWFSLLQPLIAKTNRVHAIERFGNGFSSDVEQPSYASFVPALDKTLNLLNEDELIVVSFASANILAHLWQISSDSQATVNLKGMLWIDPDILLPHSIRLYQDWPVSWYREVKDDLVPHIKQGNWTERTLTKLLTEREEINALIPVEYKNNMDWQYFDLISQGRAKLNKQVTRAKEIINYHDDLAKALNSDISTSVPITVIDTDFESHDIENAEPESVEKLIMWQQEGTRWSHLISEQSGGQYVPLNDSDHMAVFQHPSEIITAIKNLHK